MSGWYEVKVLIEHATGVSMDALHVLVGVGLQFAFAVLFKTNLGNWRPWLFVLALELINEFSDLWVEQWPMPAMQYGESLKDIVLTLFIPTMLLVFARKRPGLFGRPLGDFEPDEGAGD